MKKLSTYKDYVTKASAELKEYPYMDKMISKLKKSLEETECNFPSQSLSVKVQSSQNSGEEYIVAVIAQKEKIEVLLAERCAKKLNVNTALTQLECAAGQHYEIIKNRFLENRSIPQLENKYYQDRSTVYRNVNAALAVYIYLRFGVYTPKYKKTIEKITVIEDSAVRLE